MTSEQEPNSQEDTYISSEPMPPIGDMYMLNAMVYKYTDEAYAALGHFIYMPDPGGAARAFFDQPEDVIDQLISQHVLVVEHPAPTEQIVDLYIQYQAMRLDAELGGPP